MLTVQFRDWNKSPLDFIRTEYVLLNQILKHMYDFNLVYCNLNRKITSYRMEKWKLGIFNKTKKNTKWNCLVFYMTKSLLFQAYTNRNVEKKRQTNDKNMCMAILLIQKLGYNSSVAYQFSKNCPNFFFPFLFFEHLYVKQNKNE